MLGSNSTSPSEAFSCLVIEAGPNAAGNKRKRRPAGTPDPDAEVVSLSPKTLMESDRYVCEICGQGFQREQNLQMHRRRHKVAWKLVKREAPENGGQGHRKRVFVCPEPTCLHHDPRHALGDLVGIKKHFRRKHSAHKQWACQRCSKAYAVHSDFKAHLKTCGTRGHSCDCGRVFSRVESFIEHQDACNLGRIRSDHHQLSQAAQPPPCLSRTASSPSPSSTETTNLAIVAQKNNNLIPIDTTPTTTTTTATPTSNNALAILKGNKNPPSFDNLDLRLSSTTRRTGPCSLAKETQYSTQLQLSIGSSDNHFGEKSPATTTTTTTTTTSTRTSNNSALLSGGDVDEETEKRQVEEARSEARRQMEIAEREFADAKRVRQQARAELDRAHALKEHALRHLNSTLLHLTCHSCKHKFHIFHQTRATTAINPTAAAAAATASGDSPFNIGDSDGFLSLECHQVIDKDLMILRRVDHDHHQRSLGKFV